MTEDLWVFCYLYNNNPFPGGFQTEKGIFSEILNEHLSSPSGIPLKGMKVVVTMTDALGKVVEALYPGAVRDVFRDVFKKLMETLLEESRGKEVVFLFANGGARDEFFPFEAGDDVLRNLIYRHGVIGRTGSAETLPTEFEQRPIDLLPELLLSHQGAIPIVEWEEKVLLVGTGNIAVEIGYEQAESCLIVFQRSNEVQLTSVAEETAQGLLRG